MGRCSCTVDGTTGGGTARVEAGVKRSTLRSGMTIYSRAAAQPVEVADRGCRSWRAHACMAEWLLACVDSQLGPPSQRYGRSIHCVTPCLGHVIPAARHSRGNSRFAPIYTIRASWPRRCNHASEPPARRTAVVRGEPGRFIPRLDQSHDGPATPQEKATTRSTISYAGYGVWSSTIEVTHADPEGRHRGHNGVPGEQHADRDPALRLNTIRDTAA